MVGPDKIIEGRSYGRNAKIIDISHRTVKLRISILTVVRGAIDVSDGYTYIHAHKYGRTDGRTSNLLRSLAPKNYQIYLIFF